MKEYTKPVIIEEEIEVEDICINSGDTANWGSGDKGSGTRFI